MTATLGTPADHGTLGAWGNQGRGLAFPVDVARDPASGRLLVLNASTSWDAPHGRAVRITVLDHDGAGADVVTEISRRGTGPGELMAPVAIAVAGDGRIAVTDEHTHTVSVFGPDGDVRARWGGPGTGPGRFRHPAGIAADDGGLWVVDAGNARIQRLTWDGEPLASTGSAGLGPGQLRHPWLLTVAPDGRLWVADWGNDRIQAFSPEDGRCAAVLGSSGGEPFHRPAAVAFGADGHRYVSDWGRRRLQVFDEDWRRIEVWYGDAGLSPWARDRLAEFPRFTEARDAAGDPGGERLLGRPGGLCALPDGRVLVADTWHHRLQAYRPS